MQDGAHLTESERIALLEYKVLALSLHIQRLEAVMGGVIATSNSPSLSQMRERLSEIDGLAAALPIGIMTEKKAREMLGDGESPRRHRSIGELLKLDI